MKKLLLSVIALLAVLNIVRAQSSVDSVYLLRMPDNQRSYVRIPTTGAYFIRKTGLKADYSGWQLPDEFIERGCNVLYFEMNSTDVPDGPWNDLTSGSFQLAVEVPAGITALSLDTVNRLRYSLINNYAQRGSEKDVDQQFSGLLTFDYTTDSTVIINGTISLKTKNPYKTNQQVVYSNAKFTVFTKAQFISSKNEKYELRQQQEKAAEEIDLAIAHDKNMFFDSIFTKELVKSNKLTGIFNDKKKFNYSLNQSYLLTSATLQQRAEGSLMDMLGSNFLGVDAGPNIVYLMHCFYDPEKNTIDDEMNFSLGIELDSITTGKTYFFHKDSGLSTAILGYWHWGPSGGPRFSRSVEGTVTASANSIGQVSGKMDLTFYFNKMKIRIHGDYQLPKVSFEDVKSFQQRLEQKYGNKQRIFK